MAVALAHQALDDPRFTVAAGELQRVRIHSTRTLALIVEAEHARSSLQIIPRAAFAAATAAVRDSLDRAELQQPRVDGKVWNLRASVEVEPKHAASLAAPLDAHGEDANLRRAPRREHLVARGVEGDADDGKAEVAARQDAHRAVWVQLRASRCRVAIDASACCVSLDDSVGAFSLFAFFPVVSVQQTP